jgi:zinc/manganese transport system substrate-binding protein
MKALLFLSALLFAVAAQAKLNVVATTPDLGALAREVGGDKVDVFTMAKPTEDPHFVDAKPSFVVKLNKADALIEGGAELEIGWLSPLLEQARNTKLSPGKPGRISASQGIKMLEVPATLDRSKGDVHAAGNPHYLTDPANAKLVAQSMAKAFAALDSKSADLFKANANKFGQRIDAKLVEWKKTLKPFEGKRVVSYHNSWPYFGEQFGLKFDLFLEPKPGIPPSPAHLSQVISTMKSESIKLIVCQPHLNHRSAEFVAERTDALVIDFASYPGGKGVADDYIGWMDSLVQALAKGFAGKAK